jgi:hypothetical protein
MRRLRFVAMILLALFARSGFAAQSLSSSGPQSPVIGTVLGNVNFNYNGLTTKQVEQILKRHESQLRAEFARVQAEQKEQSKQQNDRIDNLEKRLEQLSRQTALATEVASRGASRPAVIAFSSIALDPKQPPERRRAAEDILQQIRSVTAADIAAAVQAQPVTRIVREVVLHHTAVASTTYRGAESVRGIVRFVIENNGWTGSPYHYFLAPDGLIWLGRPINETAHHVVAVRSNGMRVNADSISVGLMLDGNNELPSDAQIAAFKALMQALSKKLQIDVIADLRRGAGVHRAYAPGRSTCPGTLITTERIVSWLE